jgi:hypothetical protein
MVPFTFVVPLVIPVGGIAAGSSISNSVTVDPGLPFILNELGAAYSLDITSSTTFENRLGFTILDGESQQNFSNGQVPRERMFGTRDFPRQLPSEVDITPSDTLTVNMFNNTGALIAAGVTCTVCFGGYKLVGFTTQPPE